MNGEPLKRCSKCKTEKPLGEFRRDARRADGRRADCKACSASYESAYYATPRGQAYRQAKQRRDIESGTNAERNRRYYAASADKYRERKRHAYADNPEKGRDGARRTRARYASRSAAEIAAIQAERYPDGLKRCKRGCRELLPLGTFSLNRTKQDGLNDSCRACDVAAVYVRQYGTYAPSWDERGLYGCTYCGAPYEHADHKHPKALGGVDDPENLAPACAACNLSKSDTPLEEFRPDLFELVSSWPCEIRLVSA